MQRTFFGDDNPLAARQPKTDRLILARLLREQSESKQLDAPVVAAAHAVLEKWAELETSGRLLELHETQLQGEFLSEVFGEALGYKTVTAQADHWQLEREYTVDGGQPDAILGSFRQGEPRRPLAVVELKGPGVHLDRDRSAGRTAVQQCWDYLAHTPPECRWGIVSNIVSFRLYERNSTPRRYEHFSLQSLRDYKTFRQFYTLLRPRGLIEPTAGHPPDAVTLLSKTNNRQREVGEQLYAGYSEQRTRLIAHLVHQRGHGLDEAIEIVQRLLDRVIFIAFCEDRNLLPSNTLKRAHGELPAFSAVTNPRWQNFKTLFRFVDRGNARANIPAYNGGLFAESAADELELDDEWTQFFRTVGTYDFADEVNLDVLGHLFEQSITELEKLREGGLFGGDAEMAEQYAAMPQSAKRKRLGIYYTPPELTSRIVDYTVDELIQRRWAELAVAHGVSREQADRGELPDTLDFWNAALQVLRDLKVVDPACGSGAFLFQAYNVLEHRYAEAVGHLARLGKRAAAKLEKEIPQMILGENLYGVDLSPEAVEITQLALWIRSATPGQTLAALSDNIVYGNSLVHDPEAHSAGFDWRERFPDVFNREQAGFDCVLGNPPWERIKLQEREFFSLPAPEIATATNAAKRRKLVAKLESDNPALYENYQEALRSANALLDYCRTSGEYPLTGRGDINTYAVFAELASQLVGREGRVGLLTPSGIASDKTTKDFFGSLAESDRLIRLYDFENKKVFFPDVHASFKFCILNFGGEAVKCDAADFAFFIHDVEELEDPRRHISLSGDDIKLLNPNTRTCPIFRTRRDAEITKDIYRRVPVLVDRTRTGPTGNPWGIRFKRMFDQTNDAELFHEAAELAEQGFRLEGNRFVKGKGKKRQVFLPLYEAKMFRPYDHRHGTVYEDTTNWINQGQTTETTLVEHQNPEHLAMPRFWVAATDVAAAVAAAPSHFLCFKDVTSPTNQRTIIETMTPLTGEVN